MTLDVFIQKGTNGPNHHSGSTLLMLSSVAEDAVTSMFWFLFYHFCWFVFSMSVIDSTGSAITLPFSLKATRWLKSQVHLNPKTESKESVPWPSPGNRAPSSVGASSPKLAEMRSFLQTGSFHPERSCRQSGLKIRVNTADQIKWKCLWFLNIFRTELTAN